MLPRAWIEQLNTPPAYIDSLLRSIIQNSGPPHMFDRLFHQREMGHEAPIASAIADGIEGLSNGAKCMQKVQIGSQPEGAKNIGILVREKKK